MRAWELALSTVIRDTKPIKQQQASSSSSVPVIVNMVGTVSFLQTPYKLPLEAIAMRLGQCVQYAPKKFAAAIVKIKNINTVSTGLLFESGKMVLVSAMSTEHMRYVSQLIRVMVEQVGSFDGRTVFKRAVTHNIVGSGDLGYRVDLRLLREANPDAVKWEPDLFPAAKCSIWLTQSGKCECSIIAAPEENEDEELVKFLGKVIQKKCPCTIKCLIFDTGTVVMTGGRSVRDMNAVFVRIRQMIPQYKSASQADVAKEDRFETRLGSMMVCKTAAKNVHVRKKRTIEDPLESVTWFIAKSLEFKGGKRYKPSGSSSSKNPLIKLAQDGRREDFEETARMEDPSLLQDPELVAILENIGWTLRTQ